MSNHFMEFAIFSRNVHLANILIIIRMTHTVWWTHIPNKQSEGLKTQHEKYTIIISWKNWTMSSFCFAVKTGGGVVLLLRTKLTIFRIWRNWENRSHLRIGTSTGAEIACYIAALSAFRIILYCWSSWYVSNTYISIQIETTVALQFRVEILEQTCFWR